MKPIDLAIVVLSVLDISIIMLMPLIMDRHLHRKLERTQSLAD